MAHAGIALALTKIDRQTLRDFETHFVSPVILRRHDVGSGPIKVLA